MRIGLVTDFYYPWIGGPSTVVRNLSRGHAARGHSVFVLAPSPAGPRYVEMDGKIEVTRVASRPVPFGHNLRSPLLPTAAVRDWLDRAQPDVLHVHHPFPLCATALLVAKRRNIPVVATNHTIPECSLWGTRHLGPIYRWGCNVLGWWIVHLLRRANRVATPTHTAAQALRALGFRGEVSVISNGVDVSRFTPVPQEREPATQQGDSIRPEILRHELGLDERPIVLYTGRLDAEKEMDVWLQAAAVLAKGHDVQFVIGGEGTDRTRLEGLAHPLSIAQRVRFIGYLPDDNYPALYRLADVYFMTSPVELQSVCTLEAVSSGLPVVAVRAGALPELVRDGDNGYLVAPGDWRNAASALASLLDDPSRRLEMGVRSRAVGAGHDLVASVDQYERLLQDALTHRRTEHSGERATAAR